MLQYLRWITLNSSEIVRIQGAGVNLEHWLLDSYRGNNYVVNPFTVIMNVQVKYGKCSKISNTLISTKMLVIKAGIHKMLVRRANREDTEKTASSEAV